MLDGSWLMAQGSWLMTKGVQGRLMARGWPGPGDPEALGPGPGPEVRLWVPKAGPRPPLASSLEP